MRRQDAPLNDAVFVPREHASEERFLARRPHSWTTSTVASGRENLAELYELLDQPSLGDGGFSRESGEAALARHFARVERRDADGTVVFPNRAAVERHLRSLVLIRGSAPLKRLPLFDGPFRSRSRHTVFVAEKAR